MPAPAPWRLPAVSLPQPYQRVSAASCSQIGPRPSNQDTALVQRDLGLFVVADGMGGHSAGEIASRMAAEAVLEFIQATHDCADLTWPFGLDITCSMLANRLMVALRIANTRVYQAGIREECYAGMGTTIVAALVEGDRMVVAHVGDSRAYRLRNGELRQMTRDDTWLSVLLDAGGAAGATSHPMCHVLTNGIGLRADLTLSLTEETLVSGERWLICSDGVHNFLSPAALTHLVDMPSAEAAAERSVESAFAAGGSDNATAVVIHVD